MSARLELTPLEIATNAVMGKDEHAPLLPAVSPSLSPLQALREAILPALARPPCLVGFSGGRDSSAVLAVAADAARREGLDLPIPVTLRFPKAVETNESGWQETVIEHLNLAEWQRRDLDDELDLVGPVAQKVLMRHGLLWPSNSHFVQPMLEAARGGSLLTGLDGDDVFGWRWARAAAVLSGRTRATPRDALRVALAFAPESIRVRTERMRESRGLPWLRQPALKTYEAALAREIAGEPRRWDKLVGSWAQSRNILTAHVSLELLARGENALLIHPLSDRRFLAALAAAGGRFGFGDRSQAMLQLFGELLPENVLKRTSKATFQGAFWGPHTQALVEGWRGGGMPGELVDESALRAEWLSSTPLFASSLLVQALWITSKGS